MNYNIRKSILYDFFSLFKTNVKLNEYDIFLQTTKSKGRHLQCNCKKYKKFDNNKKEC